MNAVQSQSPSGRIYQVDLARGIACLSMPIFHTIYNLYALGLIDNNLTRSTFWIAYQKLGLGTFVFVSGMSFILSTQKGINWSRLLTRMGKLAAIAGAISLATWLVFPDKFVRFGVLHFFATAILLAPAFRKLGLWALVPGASILAVYFYVGHSGAFLHSWLYPTGLMSHRPSSIDYIPLIPWFGVFLLGMAASHGLQGKTSQSSPKAWMKPIIWLGQHSLMFYLLHQVVIYGLLMAIVYLLKMFAS